LRHGIALHLDLDQGLAPLRVDPVQIQQVMLNLIQNAIQAMQDSPSSDRILRIAVQRIGAEVRVEFVDSGPGFSSPDPEMSLAPFYTTKDSGLGMGLAIVRSIVQAHGGALHAENRRRGAAVSFTVPLDLDHAPRAADEAHCLCS
jgi:C4-dicarboxylate-specific signal transduction histidine kinase